MKSTKCQSYTCDQEFGSYVPIYESRDYESNEIVLHCLSCAMELFGVTLEEILYAKVHGLKRIN